MVFFGKLVTAMVTPYDKTGEVDYKKVQELVGHLQKTGSDGVLVCGTTGESPTVFYPQKLELFRAVLAAVAVYGVCLLKFGVVDELELYDMPAGRRLVRLAYKLHLF